eukprot:CAMPEP_0171273674 /NCGR_PEP_ID=MMETSP0790-20130122/62413_1 /TAXON_ID=2925 /ORGANISM="Alexandrium catenella, Strain OF101" /LENGTH=69 /DNA_ID=CAMNT_0011742683 /DNA_START=36 /DNA_END=241 /DNA_ORIENTATION=-
MAESKASTGPSSVDCFVFIAATITAWWTTRTSLYSASVNNSFFTFCARKYSPMVLMTFVACSSFVATQR